MRTRFVMGCLAVILMTAGAVLAQDETQRPLVPEGWMAVSEDAWDVLTSEAADLLERARGEFDGGNLERAADAVDRAAAVVTIEEARAAKEDSRNLNAAALKLQETAHEMRTDAGKNLDDRKLDDIFGQVCHILTTHFQHLAQKAHDEKDTSLQGAAMLAAADYLAQAQSWAHVTGDETIIDKTRVMARKMILGQNVYPGSDASLFDELHKQTLILRDDWLTKINPERKINPD